MKATREQYIMYNNETLLTITEKAKDTVIKDIRNNKRELLLPYDFCHDIYDGSTSMREAIKPGSSLFSNLSCYALCALHFTLIVQAASLFGAGWIINIYYLNYGFIFAKSTVEASRNACITTKLNDTWDITSLSSLARIAAKKLRTYFCNNHAKHFPVLRAMIDQISNRPPQSVCHIEATLLRSLESYHQSLSSNCIKKAVRDFVSVPEKTCFTEASQSSLITMTIESDIVDHFKKSMQLLGRMIYEHLPKSINHNDDLSWFSTILRVINIVRGPCMMIKDSLTQQGQSHPLRKEIEHNNDTINKTTATNHEHQVVQQTKICILINTAKELYNSNSMTLKARTKIHEQQKQIRGQQHIICSQELAIRALTQLYQNSEHTEITPIKETHSRHRRSLSI